jgi:hypothetical protein
MSVERVFLSKDGRNTIERILKFMSSLVIKVEAEARIYESKESYQKWIQYRRAVERIDDIYNYTYTTEDLLESGFNMNQIKENHLDDKDIINHMIADKNPLAIALLMRLRGICVTNYYEDNPYYSQFTGIPFDSTQNIYVHNLDGNYDELLLLHKIDPFVYPATYEELYIKRKLDEIIADHPDYLYLKFIERPIDIYKARNSRQYAILYYDKTSLSEYEANNFFNCYDKMSAYIMRMDYVRGYAYRYGNYEILMELLLLHGTFLFFCNSFIDKYTLNEYTDQEIYDILESKNLNNLKRVDIGLLQKIVKNLPDLLEYRGSELVMNKILDIIADKSITIKRYYLMKRYRVDNTNKVYFDQEKPYDTTVDLVFAEKVLRKGTDYKEDLNTESAINYFDMTNDDETWGGLIGLTGDSKTERREELKKEILKLDFSQLLTKYISISATIDVLSKQQSLHNMMGLLFQYCQKQGAENFLLIDELNYETYLVHPIELYAAICWCQAKMNNVENPNEIKFNLMAMTSIMIMRDINGVQALANEVPDHIITLPETLITQKLGDILGYDIDYTKYLVYSSNSTIGDVLDNYGHNEQIMNDLKLAISSSSTLEEYMAFQYLLQINQTSINFYNFFSGATSYSEFIAMGNPTLSQVLGIKLNKEDLPQAELLNTYLPLLESFKNYMANKSKNAIELTDISESNESLSYLNNLTILFNEFLSIYTQLHKIELTQSIDDVPYNKLMFRYLSMGTESTNEDNIYLHLKMDQLSSEFEHRIDEGSISLDDSWWTTELHEEFTDPEFNTLYLKHLRYIDEHIEDASDIFLLIEQSLIEESSIEFNKQFELFYNYVEDEIRYYDWVSEAIDSWRYVLYDEELAPIEIYENIFLKHDTENEYHEYYIDKIGVIENHDGQTIIPPYIPLVVIDSDNLVGGGAILGITVLV